MKFIDKTIFTLLFVFATVSSFAQDMDSTAVEDKGGFIVSGYIDAYYNLSFKNPGVGPKLWGPAAGSRAFDINNNQFSLGTGQGKFTYKKGKIEAVADVLIGPNAVLGTLAQFKNAAFPASLGGGTFGIKQLYGVWKPNDKLAFTIGQFGTHIGYEVIEPYINFHYSLSNLFNNGPFFHTGIKMNYALSDKVGLMVGLFNNWDNYDDNNGFKSPGLQLSFLPIDGMSIYLNYLTGKGDYAGTLNPEFATLTDVDGFSTSIYDITAAYAIGKVNFGLNAAYGVYNGKENSVKTAFKKITGDKKDNPTWGGIAGYFNVAATDNLSLGARVEQFNDEYAVRYIGAKNTSITITASITAAEGSLIFKPELRLDSSPSKIYFGKDGKTEDNQQTLGMAAIFKF